MLAVAVLTWNQLAVQERRQIDRTVASEAAGISGQISARLETRIQALERMAGRWDYQGRPNREQWRFDAAMIARDLPGFRAIEWADPTYHIRWVIPLEGNEEAQGLDIVAPERRNSAIGEARARNTTVIGPIVTLVQGGSGFVSYTPVTRPVPSGEAFDGLIIGVYRIDELFEVVLDGSVAPGYSVAISHGSQELYARANSGREHESEWSQQGSFELADSTWTVNAWPAPGTLSQQRTILPEVVLGGGIVLSILIGSLVYFVQMTARRADHEQMISGQLADEIVVRRQTEEELRSFTVALERSNRDLQEFAYVASHDLKAPLLSLRGMAGMLVEDYRDSLDSDARMYVDRITANAEKMQSLLDDLLEFSRISQTDAELSSVDLDQVVHSIIEQQSHNLSERDAEVTVEEDLPVVMANRGRISQVYGNLIDNALKYTPVDREPRITIGARDREDHWELFVRDNGVGIPEQYREKVYSLFQRLSDGRSLNPGGSGMGLAIVARIVEYHGGKIWVESEEGAGSTFFFTLEKQETTSPDARDLAVSTAD